MTTKQPRGHELRNCYHCGKQIKVTNYDASQGIGKYCSRSCQDIGKSIFPKVLAQLPGTAVSIAQALGSPHKTISESIGRMARRGMLHPVAIASGGPDARNVTLMLEAGPQTDPLAPLSLKLALPYFARKAILAAMPATAAQIRAKTGLGEITVFTHIAEMRAVVNDRGWQPLCFIRSYRRTLGGKQGPFMPVYERGPGKDQPCKLLPRDEHERRKRWKQGLVRDGRQEEIAERHRERQRVRKIKQQQMEIGDPMIAALYGTPEQRRAGE